MAHPSHSELLREYLDQLSEPGAESRLPKWADWCKLRLGAPLALGATLTMLGCGGDAEDPNQAAQGGTYSGSSGGASQGGSHAGGGVDSGASGGMMTTGILYGIVMQTGGKSANGGTAANGGTTSTGGMTSVVAYGIVMFSGGRTSTGGVTGTGGMTSVPPYGIVMFTGGATSIGGTTTTGGTNSGGVATGGTTSGGNATGGMPGTKYGIPITGGTGQPGTGGSSVAPLGTGGGWIGALYGVAMSGVEKPNTEDSDKSGAS